MSNIYSTLTENVQSKINMAVKEVIETVKVDGLVDVDLLMATLEQLNEKKKEIKKEAEERIKADKEAARKAASERGKAYVATLRDNVDYITFVYGDKGVKQATLLLLKKGPATAQVKYTEDMLGPVSHTPLRNIRYDKIVVPADFVMGE